MGSARLLPLLISEARLCLSTGMFLLSTPWLKLGTLETFYLSFACSTGSLDYTPYLVLFTLLLQDEKRWKNYQASFEEQHYFHVLRIRQYIG